MKKTIITAAILAFVFTAKAQNIFPKAGSTGIGTTIPKASAILDVDTVGKGVLLPRMTKAQRDAIVAPATSLLIYQTDNTPGFYYFDGGWKPVTPKQEVQIPGDNFFIVGDYQVPLTTGTGNTAVGSGAFSLNTSGKGNCALGTLALGLNTTGGFNTAIGHRAMVSNVSGAENVALGYGAMMNNVFGFYNTAVGAEALMNQTSAGIGNAAFGKGTLLNTSGWNNAAFGSYTMMNNTSGGYNAALGVYTMNGNTTGEHNTAVGNRAMLTNTTGSFNTVLGDSADVSSGALTNATAIGYKAKATASNMVQLGNIAVTSVKAGNNIVIVSDGRFKKNIKENVPGLEFIKMLKPVTYNYDIHGLDAYISPKYTANSSDETATKTPADNEYEKAVAQKEKKIYTGFVAQDVEAAANKLTYDFSGVYKPQNDKDAYGLSYADFVVPLVKAVQELSKQNDELSARIKQLEKNAGITSVNAVSSTDEVQTISLTGARLDQNTPNPFSQTTYIKYSVPSTAKKAQLIITDMNGKTVKQETIHANTNGQINIDAAGLAAGNYTYTLYVDGKRIDTKQMVHAITK